MKRGTIMENTETFGRYQVVERAGEGSIGTVFRARHVELARDAAIKVLREQVRRNAASVATITAEAGVLASLDHPNIVALYDFVEEPTRTWLAEQWVDGAPLDAILDALRRLTPEQALGVMAGALAGLAHAHASGVVHRDVAASNVLADMAGTSMLVDFGLAAPISDGPASGNAGVVGTPAYLSPEAARGEPVGKPGDVYSAAALTYHLLSGLPVFTGTAWEMVAAHRDRPAPRLAEHGPRMEDLLERSLTKEPAARPQDAAAFLAELEEAAEERYGAGWRARASIAGLVAATAGGAGLTVAGGGATVIAPAVPQAATGVTQAAVRTGTRSWGKIAAAGVGGLAAAAVATAVVAYAVTSANSDEPDDDSAAAPTTAEPTLSDEERAQQRREERVAKLEAGMPSGKYRWVSTGTAHLRNGDSNPVKKDRGTWTFPDPSCTAGRCKGQVESSSGAVWSFTWTDGALMIKRPPVHDPKAACVDTVTGETLPIGESAASWTARYDLAPASAPSGPDGSPASTITVTYESTYDWKFFGTCEPGPTDYVGSSTELVLTRV